MALLAKLLGFAAGSAQPTEAAVAAVSVGAASANSIVALNAAGKVDLTMLPPTPFATLTDGATVTWAAGAVAIANAEITLAHTTATRALTVTGMASGTNGVLVIKQDSTGGAAMTLGTSNWYLGGASGYVQTTALALTTTANAANILAWVYDGTNFYANLE